MALFDKITLQKPITTHHKRLLMKKIAAIGEVLFDSFEGKEVIGGAPFNYIYHIHQFNKLYHLGYETGFITKVGTDVRGEKVRRFFDEIGLPLQLLQSNDSYETGLVKVNFNAFGSPDYEIVEQVAYDYIDFTPETKAFIAKNMAFLYFGTLFQRSGHNKKTLAKCLPEENIFHQKVFFDINLRQNYFSWDVIDSSLLEADYLKLNQDELYLLRTKYFAEKQFYYDKDFIDFLMDEYVLDALIVTKGGKGASIYVDEFNFWEHEGKFCYDLKDTVGAGDAFSAIFTLGTLLNWKGHKILERAIDFSTEICKIQGAVPQEYVWYEKFKGWF